MVTDILAKGTEAARERDSAPLERAFERDERDGVIDLPASTSRRSRSRRSCWPRSETAARRRWASTSTRAKASRTSVRSARADDGPACPRAEEVAAAHRVRRRVRPRVRPSGAWGAARSHESHASIPGGVRRRRRPQNPLPRLAPHVRHQRSPPPVAAHYPGVPRPREYETTRIYAHYAPSAREVQLINEAFGRSPSTKPASRHRRRST